MHHNHASGRWHVHKAEHSRVQGPGVSVKNAIITELLDGNRWLILKPVIADVGLGPIVVPIGYVTDFASIPSTLHWWIRPTDKRVVRASVVHDWLYHTHLVPRGVADAVFQVILREDGTPRCKAKLMSTAVRQFGKRSYMNGPAEFKARCPRLAHHIKTTPDIE